ncbi:MAG TPA: hypothetical protein V6D17_18860 [Candidatus Obscuribacterales bacterium]
MATLISEDREVESSLVIVPGPIVDPGEIMKDQSWQQVGLILASGPFRVELGHMPDGTTKGPTTSDVVDEECLLCRKPKDEVRELIAMVDELIAGEREMVLFEPAEPFFELRISRGSVFGFRVEAWLDSGNAVTGVYRWDGVGIRMHTTREYLGSFTKQLKEEFGC